MVADAAAESVADVRVGLEDVEDIDEDAIRRCRRWA